MKNKQNIVFKKEINDGLLASVTVQKSGYVLASKKIDSLNNVTIVLNRNIVRNFISNKRADKEIRIEYAGLTKTNNILEMKDLGTGGFIDIRYHNKSNDAQLRISLTPEEFLEVIESVKTKIRNVSEKDANVAIVEEIFGALNVVRVSKQ